MSGAPSTSAWTWNSALGVYHNVEKAVWATPQASGEWRYSDRPPSPQTSNARVGVVGTAANVVDGEAEDVDGVPVEQIWPWDGADDDDSDGVELVPPRAILRLVVLSSPVLRKGQVAVIPSDVTVSIGRDKHHAERIRVKELMVSKVHANLFYFEERWCIADVGSSYGTWVKKVDSIEADKDKKGRRLSRKKMASPPERLEHLDEITVGTTTFLVHIHASLLPCLDCSLTSSGSNQLSLVSTALPTAPEQSANAPEPVTEPAPHLSAYSTKGEKGQHARHEMQKLRSQMLKSPAPSRSGSTAAPAPSRHETSSFHDRAAARRARDGPLPPPPPPQIMKRAAEATSVTAPQPEPFSAHSRGALLLAKMAEKSSGAGAGLGKLVQPKSYSSETKAGLGSVEPENVNGKRPMGADSDWRAEGRERSRRRFYDV